MSDAPSSQSTQPPPPKGRNPVERAIVYGAMAVLCLLVAIEGVGKFAHGAALKSLTALLQRQEQDAQAPEATEDDVKAILGNRQPVRTEQYEATKTLAATKKLEVYSWFTLSPIQKREIWVRYGRKALNEKGPLTVESVSIDEKEAESPLQAEMPPAEETGPGAVRPGGPQGGMMPPGMGAGPPGGPPGGPPRGRPATEGEGAGDKPAAEQPAEGAGAAAPNADQKPAVEGDKPEVKPEAKPE